MHTYISSFLASLPPYHFTLPSQVITEHRVELPGLYSCFLLAIYFAHSSIYRSIPISQFISPSPSLLCPHVRSLHLHLYSCPANRFISTIFSRVHVYALIYNICFFSFWLHSVWHSLNYSEVSPHTKRSPRLVCSQVSRSSALDQKANINALLSKGTFHHNYFKPWDSIKNKVGGSHPICAGRSFLVLAIVPSNFARRVIAVF